MKKLFIILSLIILCAFASAESMYTASIESSTNKGYMNVKIWNCPIVADSINGCSVAGEIDNEESGTISSITHNTTQDVLFFTIGPLNNVYNRPGLITKIYSCIIQPDKTLRDCSYQYFNPINSSAIFTGIMDVIYN